MKKPLMSLVMLLFMLITCNTHSPRLQSELLTGYAWGSEVLLGNGSAMESYEFFTDGSFRRKWEFSNTLMNVTENGKWTWSDDDRIELAIIGSFFNGQLEIYDEPMVSTITVLELTKHKLGFREQSDAVSGMPRLTQERSFRKLYKK